MGGARLERAGDRASTGPLGARPLDEWTVYRIDDEPLDRLGRAWPPTRRSIGPDEPLLPAPHRPDGRLRRPASSPRDGGFIKLNTNENPYPPSPRVAEAIARRSTDRLRLYPDPVGTAFREAAARRHGVEPEMVLAGNGSDDLLTIITRAFAGPGDPVARPDAELHPLPTLAELQDARIRRGRRSRADWSLDPDAVRGRRRAARVPGQPEQPLGDRAAARRASPSWPSGSTARWSSTRPTPTSPRPTASAWSPSHPNVIVTRSFSKGYSLAGLRLGYLIARPEIVAGLIKVKDSYNCDTLSLARRRRRAGGPATTSRQTRARILATRRRLTDAIRALGYHVPESQANFVWCTGGPPAAAIYQAAQGPQDPRPPDALPRPPRRPADHRRHRRRDRPAPRRPSQAPGLIVKRTGGTTDRSPLVSTLRPMHYPQVQSIQPECS